MPTPSQQSLTDHGTTVDWISDAPVCAGDSADTIILSFPGANHYRGSKPQGTMLIHFNFPVDEPLTLAVVDVLHSAVVV